MVDDKYTIDVAKKVLQKAIVNEMHRNGIVEFAVCSNILKKIDIEINRTKKEKTEEIKKKNITIKIPL